MPNISYVLESVGPSITFDVVTLDGIVIQEFIAGGAPGPAGGGGGGGGSVSTVQGIAPIAGNVSLTGVVDLYGSATSAVAAEAALRVTGDAASVSTAAGDATAKVLVEANRALAAEGALGTGITAAITALAATGLVIVGSGFPADTVGQPGEFFVDLSTIAAGLLMYGPKNPTGNTWLTFPSTTTQLTWADSNTVHLTGTETISGQKTFTTTSATSFAGTVVQSAAPRWSVSTRTAAITLAVNSAAYNHCDATSAAFTVTLPSTTTSGYVLMVMKTDATANAVTVAATSFNGGAANLVLSSQFDYVLVESTTTSGAWQLVGGSAKFLNGVDLASTQTVAGVKTFSNGISVGTQLIVGGQLINTGQLRYQPNTPAVATTLTLSSSTLQYCDATTAAFTVTLPAVATAGIKYIIMKTDSGANAVSVTGTLINGVATRALANQWDYIIVSSTTTSGTWQILGGSSSVLGLLTLSGSQTVTGTPTFSTGFTVSGGTAAMNGAVKYTPSVRTGTVTLTTTSSVFNHCDGTSGAFTITMPATTSSGVVFMLKKTDSGANAVTIALTNMDGLAGNLVLVNQGDWVMLESTSTSGNWVNVGGSPRFQSPWVPDTGATASTATPSIDCRLYDEYDITALTVAITGVTVTGIPGNGQELFLRIASASAVAIALGTSFAASGVAALPTATVAGKTISMRFRYNSTSAKWVCLWADPTGY